MMWTNHVADGPSHSMQNVPHIIWGNGGGYLKQGAVRRRRQRDEQQAVQHADHRGDPRQEHHDRGFRRRERERE